MEWLLILLYEFKLLVGKLLHKTIIFLFSLDELVSHLG